MEKLIKKNDRIFLAGANGMVGSSIKRILKNKGYGQKKQNLLTPSKKELDLSNYLQLKDWMKKNNPDVVIVAAAKVGGILANSKYPADFLLENLKIQTNVIELSWLNGVKRLLFLGSSCIYPKNHTEPIIEEYLLNSKLEKTNEFYAIAKICGIKLCESLRKQYNFDAISLMPTNLYGPNDNYDLNNSHVMPALIKKFLEAKKNNYKSVTCWGSGSPLREFMYVDDLAEASIYCLENWDLDSENAPKDKEGKPLTLLNVGTGKDISIKELALKIASITGFKGEIIWDKSKPDGTKRKLLNINRIRNLGWEAKIDLDEGINRTIKDIKKSEIT